MVTVSIKRRVRARGRVTSHQVMLRRRGLCGILPIFISARAIAKAWARAAGRAPSTGRATVRAMPLGRAMPMRHNPTRTRTRTTRTRTPTPLPTPSARGCSRQLT